MDKIKRNVFILSCFNFLLDFRPYAPIAVLYFSRVTGSFALGMSVFSVIMLSAALFEVPTGIFSDRIGRRLTVVCGAFLTVLAVLSYAIGGSYWVLLLGALAEGMGRSFFSGNNEALLFDTLKEAKQEEHYSEYFGKTEFPSQVALAASSILGGIIAFWSFNLVMWLSVIPQLLGLIVVFFAIEPSVHKKNVGNVYAHLKEAFFLFLANAKLRKLSLASMITFGVGESIFTFRAAFISTVWPLWAVGFSNTVSNVFGALSFYFSGKILKKVEPLRALILTNIYNRSVSYIALLFPTVLSPILLSSSSLFHGIKQVAQSTLLNREYSHEKRATMASLNSFGGNLLFAVASFSLGAAADRLGPVGALLIAHTILLAVIFLHWSIFRKKKSVIITEAQ